MRHTALVCFCCITSLSLVLAACNYPSGSSGRETAPPTAPVPLASTATAPPSEPAPTPVEPVILVEPELTPAPPTAATVEYASPQPPLLTQAPATTAPPPVDPASPTPVVLLPTHTSPPAVEAPPDVAFVLPDEAIRRLEQVAFDNGMQWTGMAAQHTVIYAYPDDRGVAYLLTPARQMPRMSPEDLVQDTSVLERVVLGGLTVINVDDLNFPLSPGAYVITLNHDGQTIEFTADHESATFDAIIRALPQPMPRPVALITSSQMCLGQRRLQVCARLDTTLPDDLAERMFQAMGDLGVDSDAFAFERALPDIEGFRMVERCARALAQRQPAYRECQATILAVPAQEDGSMRPPALPELQDAASVTSISMILVLDHLVDQVFQDPRMRQPAPELPPGPYLTYEILYPGEFPAWGRPVDSRVMQTGPQGTYYLPARSSDVIIGEPLMGDGLPNEEEAVIINLIIRGRCIFKWWQCSDR